MMDILLWLIKYKWVFVFYAILILFLIWKRKKLVVQAKIIVLYRTLLGIKFIKKIAEKSKISDGICYIYVPHATCAITINENYDPNVCDDILNALNKLIPQGVWKHDAVDNNGAAHIKSAIIGASEFIPINGGELKLGRWQDIMLADFDGPRKRTVYVQIVKTG